jgi:hypothetical protein
MTRRWWRYLGRHDAATAEGRRRYAEPEARRQDSARKKGTKIGQLPKRDVMRDFKTIAKDR